MRALWLLAALWLAATAARADRAGDFDYYVLSLSWSPQYCAAKARPDDSQCQRPHAFVVHGLWPQHERGYPDRCGRGAYLDDSLIQSLLPIMPSKPLIIHEWQKHGVCSGLSAQGYFETLTRAHHSVEIPARYQAAREYLSTDVAGIKAAFIAANPHLNARMISVQCSGQYLQEVRICMGRDLQTRNCGSDLRDRCGRQVVLRPSR